MTKTTHPAFSAKEIDLSTDEQSRFWTLVNKQSECWIWEGTTNAGGYGTFQHNGRQVLAHRVAYTLDKGTIPTGLVIDHLCAKRPCVNPDHLEAVSVEENVHRAVVNGQIPRPVLVKRNKYQRVCKQGHEMTEDNVYTFPSSGVRRCRICLAEAQRRAYLSRKARKAGAA